MFLWKNPKGIRLDMDVIIINELCYLKQVLY